MTNGEQIVCANGVDLCVETFGAPTDPRYSSSVAEPRRWTGGTTSSANASPRVRGT